MSRDIKFRYVFRRKDDGHIWMLIVSLKGFEEIICGAGPREIESVLDNELWEHISRDQFTGLLDKNGTEIYEGDILCIPEYTPRDDGNYDDEVVEVYFDDGRLIWAFRFGSYGFDYLTEAEGATIIGNVHEHRELLP